MSSPVKRIRLALEMFEVGVELYRKRLERTRPELTAAEIKVLVQEWLLARPGAEHGDSAGVPFVFPKNRP